MHVLKTPPPPLITSLVVHPLGQHDPVFSSYLSLFPSFFPSAKCLSSLSSLPASSLSSEYGPLLNCLCSWDRTTDVLELINDLIASRMTGQRKDIKMVLNCVVNCFCFQFEVVSKFNEICTRKPQKQFIS